MHQLDAYSIKLMYITIELIHYVSSRYNVYDISEQYIQRCINLIRYVLARCIIEMHQLDACRNILNQCIIHQEDVFWIVLDWCI